MVKRSFPSKICPVDERSIVRGVTRSRDEMLSVRRERQIASIILTHSHLVAVCSPRSIRGWSKTRSIFSEKIAYSFTAKIGKLSTGNETVRTSGVLSSHASRNRAEWDRVENGVKMSQTVLRDLVVAMVEKGIVFLKTHRRCVKKFTRAKMKRGIRVIFATDSDKLFYVCEWRNGERRNDL